MIDLQGLFNGLVQFFEQAPTGTRQQFIDAIVQREIATAEDAGRFADAFVATAADLLILADGADFDAMMAKVRSTTLPQAVRAARTIFSELEKRVEFRVEVLTERLAVLDSGIAELTARKANAEAGQAWLVANGQAGQVLDDTLLVLDAGLTQTHVTILAAERQRVRLAEEIEKLGG